MQVPDEVRKCVVFLCCQTPKQMQLLGTAFFVGESIESTGQSFFFLVTAKHIIEAIRRNSIDRKVYVRINVSEAKFTLIETDIELWIFHPSDPSVDVAILPLAPPRELDYLVYPLSASATEDRIPKLGIGAGDEVFLVGLFISHAGSKRNIPIVRVGNIAGMPEEPVQTRQGLMDAYLIEARSIGGLSGSPVFVHLPPVRFREGKPKFLQGDYFYLLGLVHGHWDLPICDTDMIGEDTLNRKAVNMGIAIVIPVDKILEVINQPGLEELKRRTKEKLTESSLLE